MSDSQKKVKRHVVSREGKAKIRLGKAKDALVRDPQTGEIRLGKGKPVDRPSLGQLSAAEQTSIGTARMITFRCPADLEGRLTRTATDLGISVSRAVDGLLREGFDVRAQRSREEQLTERLEGALVRLELLAQAKHDYHDLFEKESILVGAAVRECGRGERRLLDLANVGFFNEPFHRFVWGNLQSLLNSSPRSETANTSPKFIRALEAMYQPDAQTPDPFEAVGGVGSYLDLVIEKLVRPHEKADRWYEFFIEHDVTEALSVLLNEALNRLVQGSATDPEFEKRYTRGRSRYLEYLPSR